MKNFFAEEWYPGKKQFNLEKNKNQKQQFGKKYGYYSQLLVRGVGSKFWIDGHYLNMDVGLTHYVSLFIPTTINIVSKKVKLILFSQNEQDLFNFIFLLRKIKLPDPYKGKGIRFFNENIKLKVGKVKN